jgi:ribosomal peptide maturation radical SAM protein 1
MYRVSLINMPFAVLQIPSIALTQLKSIVMKELGDRVSVDVLYLNHDFAEFLGVEDYGLIGGSHDSQITGFGDWLFRKLAFPELPENTEEYFRRYFPHRETQNRLRNSPLFERLRGADEFIDSLIDKYSLDKVDVVGFTSMFAQNVASFAMARKVKERNPGVITVIGGANCEWPMGREIARNVKNIDYVFSGPALKSFPEFLVHCMNNDRQSCRDIKGVLCRQTSALMPLKAAIGEELPLDVEVELDYDSFLKMMEDRFAKHEIAPSLLFETSRGCWWGEKAHCTFCGLNGESMAYRSMGTQKATNLLKSLFKYSTRVRRLEAVDNIMPKSFTKEVFPALETPSTMHIFYEVKADLSEEDMQELARVRVLAIQPGIESLATSTLKLMKKGTSAFQNLVLLKRCLTYGIYPHWNLLVGFPGEDEEVYKKYLTDVPLLTHLPPPSGAYPVRFDRFSPYFVQAKEYGLDLHPLDYYSFIYPFDQSSLTNMAYYFDDRNVRAPYRMKMSNWIDPLRTKVEYWKARWNKESAVQAKLYCKPDSTVIYDSRADEVVEHQVGQVGKRVLDYLAQPRRLSDLTSAFSDVPGFDAERKLALLQHRGLIFQEGDRYLSLVMPGDTAKLKPTY